MSRLMTMGFVAAGLMNIVGVLLFSRCLTNDYVSDLYPEVFSFFGLLVIILWGMAYLAVARRPTSVPGLVAVFAIEKLLYTLSWFLWLAHHGGEFRAIWNRDMLTAVFYAIYGPNDLLFGLFFAWVARRTWKVPPPK